MEDNSISEISLIVRRKLPEWDAFEKSNKVKFIVRPHYENLVQEKGPGFPHWEAHSLNLIHKEKIPREDE